MADLTLGLDIGTNSLGWALVDERGSRIVAAGVRVFPEGVDRDTQGGEKSKSAARRTARGMRRQLARRRRRRRHLREVLIQAALLPSRAVELGTLLSLNPYQLRRRGLDTPLEPYHFGRVLLHLNARRGFLSNRKTDRTRRTEVKGMLAEINDLAKEISASGSRTLGEYLARLDKRFDPKASPETARIRRRHTRRDMYEYEFDILWSAQQKHHPDVLTEELKERVRQIIFFQRPMYWPKSLVGRCELEPKLLRCSRGDRAAQRFRLLQEVNNLRVLEPFAGRDRPLTDQERSTLISYLSTAKDRSFDQMRKKLGLPDDARFNYERGERGKLKGHQTDAAMASKKALGKTWTNMPDTQKDAIVAVVVEEEREDVALKQLMDECGLPQEQAERALGVSLPDGHMNLSRTAIVKLLPHLERGLPLMGDDESNSALHAAGYLRPDQRAVRQRDFLPAAPDVPNPIVRQALVEVRKVVNAVIREYATPSHIHVELAREAKRSLEGRREILIDNARRRQARDEAAQRIEEHGDKPTRATIQNYLLWQEQGEQCAYSGRCISVAQLLSDAVDVDHILPRWRSLDNSMANKVICFREENAAKGDHTPREWLEHGDPDKYERVLRVAQRLPYGKQRKFVQKDIVLDEFVERQLRDTAYITRCVTQYLRCLGARVVTPRGAMTAELRHFWGLNTILDPEGRGKKNRADHRHHAIDATVIALTNSKRLHALANARGSDVPPPWARFREDVESAMGKINVSHRVRRRIAGELHEATFYGATHKLPHPTVEDHSVPRPWSKGWVERDGMYVRRKSVTELTDTKQIGKVRDPTIRQILQEHLRQRGIDPHRPGRIPSDAFKGGNTPRMPTGMPIRRARMLEESTTIRRVSRGRAFQYVKPGSNHHIVYHAEGQRDQEKWIAQVVTMWDAAQRARRPHPIPIVNRSDQDGKRFVMSLSINEMFQIDGAANGRLLCVVRKIDQRSLRVHYKVHTDARVAGEINKDNLYLSPERMRKCNARKVTVDPLGRIRWAHD
ncbi:MAG TPA: type II CRISPR RNA-guided endonuclease Cas9 [Phycisphaerae bacterium]|nr:type II CRISPR RNA-guided endonuclease Cas9 [Phycisphaerae bacterium]